MAVREACGNDYDKAMQVSLGGKTHTFDSFECAIHALAPTCAHCGMRIIGHGVEERIGVAGHGLKRARVIFCCAGCATRATRKGLKRCA